MNCRLCGGSTRYVFSNLILAKHDTAYWQCVSCGSLQTSPPHWLEEAYSFSGTHIDVGQASRCIRNWVCLNHYFKEFGVSHHRCLDYGGSAGLLARLMRDSGFDFYCYDAYSVAKYADYFQVPELIPNSFAVITAFEVFEHFPNPASELANILSLAADIVIFSTELYDGQGKDWEYLVPCCGQHVFFYTAHGLETFGKKFGYTFRQAQDFHLFVREEGAFPEVGLQPLRNPITAATAGALLTSTCWGTAATAQDAAYARNRFTSELNEQLTRL